MESLMQWYKTKVPSARKVIKSLQLPTDMNEQNRSIITYLSQFIKTLNSKELCMFLRSGSDTYARISRSQVVRAPQAQVCVCQLELSNTYSCYNELSEEFSVI